MLPAGKYYVGDLCYVMHPQWDEVCHLMFALNAPDSGEFTLENGVKFASQSTAYGDGTYFDQDNRKYPVDAGLIGCIRVRDIIDPKANLKGGNIIKFDQPFETSFEEEGGIIRIGHIVIKTGEDEEDEYYEGYEDDED